MLKAQDPELYVCQANLKAVDTRSYHQIAKKFGKVELITLCPNLNRVLIDDPLIKSVNYLDKII